MARTIFDDIKKLIQLDVDAVYAYEKALEKIEEATLRDQLYIFKADHQRHVDDLCDYLSGRGQDIPDRKPDIKGQFLEGFTALRSSSGTKGALKAMKSNEKMTNKKYDQASGWDMESELREIVLKNYKDEQKHLSYIEEQLEVKTKS